MGQLELRLFRHVSQIESGIEIWLGRDSSFLVRAEVSRRQALAFWPGRQRATLLESRRRDDIHLRVVRTLSHRLHLTHLRDLAHE